MFAFPSSTVLLDWFLQYGAQAAILIFGVAIAYQIAVSALSRAFTVLIANFPKERADRVRVLLEHVVLRTVRIVFLVFGLLLVLPAFGFNVVPVLAGLGIIGFALTFGVQSLVKDVVSGIFVLLEDQYREGDRVRIGDIKGVVTSFSLRSVVIRNEEGLTVIPHSEVKTVTNLSAKDRPLR